MQKLSAWLVGALFNKFYFSVRSEFKKILEKKSFDRL